MYKSILNQKYFVNNLLNHSDNPRYHLEIFKFLLFNYYITYLGQFFAFSGVLALKERKKNCVIINIYCKSSINKKI